MNMRSLHAFGDELMKIGAMNTPPILPHPPGGGVRLPSFPRPSPLPSNLNVQAPADRFYSYRPSASTPTVAPPARRGAVMQPVHATIPAPGSERMMAQAPTMAPISKVAAELTPAARAELPKKDFAVKAKSSNTGKEAYPIPDRQHARSALGFAKMHGDSADLASVRAKIKAKYPDMLDKTSSVVERLRGALSSPMGEHATELTELAGLGMLAVPGADELQAHARAAMAGQYDKEGVKKRELLPAMAHPLADVAGLGTLAVPELMKLRGHA